MTKLTIETAPDEDFFQRGRRLARSADRGEKLPDERIVSFEDPGDMMQLVTAVRLAVFRAARDRPGSITEISARLQRDRSAVKRDVDALEQAGLVTVADKILPGHRRMKEVHVTAKRISLQAELQ
jgi:predicted transcriptional regulator